METNKKIKKVINFSGWQGNCSRFLRICLRLIPKETVLPIIQGPLRGKRWVIGSLHLGSWLGSYELANQKFFQTHITRGTIVYDIGANVGIFSLLAEQLGGVVYAFEPLSRNYYYL